MKIQVFILAMVTFLFSAASVKAQTFTFGAAGDFSTGSNFEATVGQVAAHNPDFMIALGDFAYAPVEQEWCNVWKAQYQNILLIVGNHDSGESSGGLLNKFVQFCPYTLSTPFTGKYGKEYYFDYPAANPIARFILISPGIGGAEVADIDTDYIPGSTGYTFVSNAVDDARNRGIKWIVVGSHKNHITAMEKSNQFGEELMDMLIEKRVDLVLQGHEHGYERSKQLDCARVNTFDASCVVDSDDSLVKGAGTVIHVLGTGGKDPRDLNTSDSEYQYFKALDVTTNGFGKFTVSSNVLNFQFIRSAGGNFSDSFTITDGGGTAATPTPAPVGKVGDINGDNRVDIVDVGLLVDAYGILPIANPQADLNTDGRVDIVDVGLIIDNYGL
jgi:hypothetical protein